MRMRGARAVVKALEDQGVTTMFGIPGGVLIPIFDALYDSKKIRFVLSRHEQGAAHMADGYARASGKVGVCIATSGPGATNLVTGLTTACMDSVPVLALTGQVATGKIGTDAFQEADVFGITLPVVKHSYLIKDPDDLVPAIVEALYLAGHGRPGPVLVDIPVDMSMTEVDYDPNLKVRMPCQEHKLRSPMSRLRKEATDAIT